MCTGCGFLDTATQLVKLGADVNARDLTQCTPLQNAAHGTYSALATMPLNGTQNAVTGKQTNFLLYLDDTQMAVTGEQMNFLSHVSGIQNAVTSEQMNFLLHLNSTQSAVAGEQMTFPVAYHLVMRHRMLSVNGSPSLCSNECTANSRLP